VTDESVKILDGNTFVVSDPRRDIEATATDPAGLFSSDTRFLSTWVLTVNGERLNALSTDDLSYFETRYFLVPGTGTVYVDSKLSVIRQRSVSEGFHETLTVLNHDDKPVDLTVRIEAGSDFADLFEVKDALAKKGKYTREAAAGRLLLGYARDTFRRSTTISSTPKAAVDDAGLTFRVHLEPQGSWVAELDVDTMFQGLNELRKPSNGRRGRLRENMEAELELWIDGAPRLDCDWEPLLDTYRRSLVDLAALRFRPLTAGRRSLPAAGLPWFMTMFGRDSILTSLQALPFTPELAGTTLRELGLRQGTRVDDFRDEDPGRILHEVRYGELTAFEERPHSPYFGSADATPLYVVLLDEYERWTGDRKLVRELEGVARAALTWIDEYADLQDNGYISYQRRNEETGLENQCWKDSWDSISYRDGRLPGFPRATCELQGYAYDAKRRGARLARTIWKDQVLADELERQAESLKRRFNRDFWVEDGKYSPSRLRPTGARSTPSPRTTGTCCGAASSTRRRRRRSRGTCSGRGSSPAGAFGPSRKARAATTRSATTSGRSGRPTARSSPGSAPVRLQGRGGAVAAGILDAAEFFDGRLPEAFGGYERSLTKYPVQYPTACSPQAWSTGAPLLLLRTMLGLEPVGDHLVVDPALPVGVGHLELLDIPGRWGRVDAFGRGMVSVDKGKALRPQLGTAR
jgi:glycogen debranching enzyme